MAKSKTTNASQRKAAGIASSTQTAGTKQAIREMGGRPQGFSPNLATVANAASRTAGTTAVPMSAVDALKQDHRRVEQLFADYEGADDGRKDQLLRQICIELIIHTKLEEEIFYPACREAVSEEDMLDEAQVEHDSAKLLIAD